MTRQEAFASPLMAQAREVVTGAHEKAGMSMTESDRDSMAAWLVATNKMYRGLSLAYIYGPESELAVKIARIDEPNKTLYLEPAR